MKNPTRHRLAILAAYDFGYHFLKRIRHVKGAEMMVISYDDIFDPYYGFHSTLGFCRRHGIAHHDTTASRKGLAGIIKDYRPTHILCGFYAKILSSDALAAAEHGAFNVHPGELPRYRGPFPTAWAILNQESHVGITIHRMDAGIDTGDVLFQKRTRVLSDETGFELNKRVMRLSAEFFADRLPAILARRFAAKKQKGYGTYYGAFPGHLQIDWRKPCRAICAEVRLHAPPYLPAYSLIKNRIVLIKRCSLQAPAPGTAQGPGVVLQVFGDGRLLVSGVDACILIEDYECVPADPRDGGFAHLRPGVKFQF